MKINSKVSKVVEKDNGFIIVFAVAGKSDGIGTSNTKYFNKFYPELDVNADELIGVEYSFSSEQVRVSEFVSNGKDTKGVTMKRYWIMDKE